MKVFSVCGITQSGKTTTSEHIIRELTARGYRVGSVKEIHYENFAIDPDPSSNTKRHRQAGAGLVTARGFYETDLLFPGKLGIEKILSFYEGEYDWVVMEGVSDASVPVVVTAQGEDDLNEKWSGMAICVSGLISAQINEYRGVPAIDATTNAAGLADLLAASVHEWQEAFVFRSKRNKVLLRGGIVEKHFASIEAASYEAAALERLYAAGVSAPELIVREGCIIKMRYISGETLPDVIARLEKTEDRSALKQAADEIIRWLGSYYRAVDTDNTGEIRGDVNGRNFLFDGKRCWGVDFEEPATGVKEQDIGRLVAYVLTYDPPGTTVKKAFADRLLDTAEQTLGADVTVVCHYRDQEQGAMRARRGAGSASH